MMIWGWFLMAKFYMEDGTIKSDDRILREYYGNNGMGDCTICRYRNDVKSMLKNIANNLHSHDENIDKKCVLDLLTGKRHTCKLKTEYDETGKPIKKRDCEYCIMLWGKE